ncbi:MAG: ferrochelatase [Acidobacteriota bacterium]|nr:ferrochelatase [Acidobacteriota bacterium]
MQASHSAILLLAHGTPNALHEMADYLHLVTSGRTLPHEVVEELQHRYAEIGLADTPRPLPPPLTRWTLAQRDLLQAHLAISGTPVPVYAAMRNWHPLIADVVLQIRADGITRLTALCLAPQNSRTSIGLYKRALTAALAASAPPSAPDPIALTFVDAWAEEPHLIAAFAQRLAEAHTRALAKTGTPLPILFTAHSVPCRTIMVSDPSAPSAPAPNGRPAPPPQTTPDPYPVEAKRTAALVFEKAFAFAKAFADSTTPPPPTWFFAFQSQGVAGGPWIGPTVQDTLAAIAAQGFPGVILQPIGFLCDHVEILYDIDIDFQHTARDLNLQLFRPESLNDSPLLTQALATVLQPHL